MLPRTFKDRVEQAANERRQHQEQTRRLHNLADRVLHVPRAPTQILSSDDPRKTKLRKTLNETDEQVKFRQFSNTADEVELERMMVQKKEELFGHKNNEPVSRPPSSSTPNRPLSARSFTTIKNQKLFLLQQNLLSAQRRNKNIHDNSQDNEQIENSVSEKSTVAPSFQRNRMFSCIQIVDTNFDDNEEDDTTPNNRNARNKRRLSASGSDESCFMSLNPVHHNQQQQNQHQRSSNNNFLDVFTASHRRQQQQQQPDQVSFHQTGDGTNNAMLQDRQSQKSFVQSGIFNTASMRRRQEMEERQQYHQKVVCKGDVRLKVVEREWNSAKRKLPNARAIAKQLRLRQRSESSERHDDETDGNREKLQDDKTRTNDAGNGDDDDDGDGELKLQCVLEYEEEAARDAKELAVTFTERFLKVKDGSCRPLYSRFAATAKKENEEHEKMSLLASGSPARTSPSLGQNNNHNNNSNQQHNPRRKSMLLVEHEKNSSSKLPRSSWHVDFSVREPEKHIWNWFQKYFYDEANHHRENVADSHHLHHASSSTSFQQQREPMVSASLLKNVTFSGCVKGFNSKSLKIPEPVSLEDQIEKFRRDIEMEEDDRFQIVGTSEGKSSSSDHRKENNNNNNNLRLSPDSQVTRKKSSFRFNSMIMLEQQQNNNKSRISPAEAPAALMKAESFRFGLLSSTTNNVSGAASPAVLHPESSLKPNDTTQLLSSIARFRTRRFTEATAVDPEELKREQLEREQFILEAKREEVRRRKKILALDSITFLQCSMDCSAKFFKELAHEKRVSCEAICLEHCKLPRQEDEEERIRLKQIKKRKREKRRKRKLMMKEGGKNQNEENDDEDEDDDDSEAEQEKIDKDEEALFGVSLAHSPSFFSSGTLEKQITSSGSGKFGSSSSIGGRKAVRPSPPLLSIRNNKNRKTENVHAVCVPTILPPSSINNNNQNDENRQSLSSPSGRELKVAFLENVVVEDEKFSDDDDEEDSESKQIDGGNAANSNYESDSDEVVDEEDDLVEEFDPSRNVDEEFTEAFLYHFVYSQNKTLKKLSLHGTRLSKFFLQKLSALIRSKKLSSLVELDIGLCGIESVDATPLTSKTVASALAHAPPSLTHLSLAGTALSPTFVGISFSAAIRANTNLRIVECVGCDRGGTKFETLVNNMLRGRNAEYEKIMRRKRRENRAGPIVTATMGSVRTSVARSDSTTDENNQQVEARHQFTTHLSDDDQDYQDDEHEPSPSGMLVPTRSVRLIEDADLF